MFSGANMEDSWSATDISQIGTNIGDTGFGGLAGLFFGCLNANNCYAYGDVNVNVTGNVPAGGFVGYTIFDESFGTNEVVANYDFEESVVPTCSLGATGTIIIDVDGNGLTFENC